MDARSGPWWTATIVLSLLLRAADPFSAPSVAGRAPPGVRPVPGEVIRPFDPPDHPYGPGHRGVDLAATQGEPVRSVRRGTVIWAGTVADVGYVTVDHGGGLTTTYADVEPVVARGQIVGSGQRIALLAGRVQGVSGDDGHRTHLDWGARWDNGWDRIYLDPLLLLDDLRPVLVWPAGPEVDV